MCFLIEFTTDLWKRSIQYMAYFLVTDALRVAIWRYLVTWIPVAVFEPCMECSPLFILASHIQTHTPIFASPWIPSSSQQKWQPDKKSDVQTWGHGCRSLVSGKMVIVNPHHTASGQIATNVLMHYAWNIVGNVFRPLGAQEPRLQH